MAWMTIARAVTMTGVAQSTWYFRIKNKEWPTRKNIRGEREIWAECQKTELSEAIAEIRTEAAAFREQRITTNENNNVLKQLTPSGKWPINGR